MRFVKTLFIPFFLLLIPAIVGAQTTNPAAKETSTTNMLAILMIIIALVLAFVIYALGQVLVTLIRQVMEKNRLNGKVIPGLLLFGFLVTGFQGRAEDVVADKAAKELPNYGGLSADAFWTLVSAVAIEVVAILFLMFFINRIRQELMPAKAATKSFDFQAWWSRVDKKLFTKAVPVEQEADIVLDHEYDGIRELDNSLPPWWKYGFIITIAISVVYMLHFHVLGSGKNPTEEYAAELQNAKVKLEAYEAKNKDKVDENNIQLADAGGIADGKDIFQQMCWACHGKMGEGGAGPNLTDEFWLHKGSLNDIYKSIKSGYPDKGMQSWEKQYSPKQIAHLASYIKSLKGTKPANGKAAQGDLYTEAGAATDSTSTTSKEATVKN
jgi:cytochrome c oxidase cbb3-type subunit 3